MEYIRDFDHQTRDGTDDVRFLVVDGHSSHISDGFLDYVREAQDIELACYIPHSTHIYQGLDVGIHGPLKTYFGQERNKLEEEGQVVTKEVYSKAHVKAMTPENIRAVFRKTGIHPFDRSVVTDEMMAPSQETSTAADTVFPTTQPGPVDMILQAIQHVNPLHPVEDLEKENTPLIETPTHRRSTRDIFMDLTPRSQNIDPALLSPISQHARLLTNNLREDGYAFLVPGNDTFSSQTEIPAADITNIPEFAITPSLLEPGDDCASRQQLLEENASLRKALQRAQQHDQKRNKVLERANAQLVIQGLYGAQLKRKLFQKEQNKSDSTGAKRRKLMASRWGRHLTSRKFQAAMKTLQGKDEAAKRDRSKKQSIREIRKKKREWRDREVQGRKQQREREISRWERDRDRAKAAKQKALAKPKVPERAKTPEDIAQQLHKLETGDSDVLSSEDDEDEDV